MRYVHQQDDWPKFRWDAIKLAPLLAEVRHRQGRLLGRMEGLGFQLRAEAVLETLTLDVIKSSEIEGDILDAAQVRSSVARRLGMDIAAAEPADRHIDGVVEMMLDATQRFDQPITDERLQGWQAALFPTGFSGMHRIAIGQWRDDAHGPMQVVSGAISRERVHFEAPAAPRLPQEMAQFIATLNATGADDPLGDCDPVLRAGIAHLWFVTIHPFDDGNGRIARAIADWALARAEKTPQRFYSMSAQIRRERGDYYDILERTQKGTLEITEWLAWFLRCLSRAIDATESTLAAVLFKARFWQRHSDKTLNERQRHMLNKMLDGLEGKLTSSKWAKMTKTSQDTAHRDIQALIEQGVLRKEAAGGRSTSYAIATDAA